MIFAILTLLSALSLASVAGWFSIIGVASIYAGAPFHAIIMGIVLEAAKLVTTSWLYRNWEQSSFTLKTPLIIFTVALMIATSIGVFGFLSKAHIQQGAETVDNSAKVERLDQQIAREKSVIADNEKVTGQLDATINSYLGKDRADRAVVIRKSQAQQRKQLRDDIDAAQKKIDALSEEKFKLQSEVRKLQLDVGPIRYIAELMYGTDSTEKNIEAAVRIFTLLIVSILDPLAVVLLVAANHTILKVQNEKKSKTSEKITHSSGNEEDFDGEDGYQGGSEISETVLFTSPPSPSSISVDNTGKNKDIEETEIHAEILKETVEPLIEKAEIIREESDSISEVPVDGASDGDTIRPPPLRLFREEISATATELSTEDQVLPFSAEELPIIRSPISRISWLHTGPHFVPLKINEEEKIETVAPGISPEPALSSNIEATKDKTSGIPKVYQGTEEADLSGKDASGGEDSPGSEKRGILQAIDGKSHKYPRALSWLKEFTRTENE